MKKSIERSSRGHAIPIRRTCGGIVTALLLVCSSAAQAQQPAPTAAPAPGGEGGPQIFVVKNQRREPYKIAIPTLLGDAEAARTVAEVVSGDLSVSGWFKVLDPKGFLANLQAEGLGVVLGDWRNVGAEGVSKGKATAEGGEIALEFSLYSIGTGDQPVLQKKYRGPSAKLRSLAHEWSAEIVKFFTTEDSFFNTQIAFASSSGPGKKDIYVMDYDGANLHKLTDNGSQNILPAWSASGDRVFFTSFLRGNPDLYSVGLGGGRPKKISDRPGVNMGASSSPDGGTLALTLSQDGNSEIYTIGAGDGSILKRLTNNPFIDSSPAWSPDGGQLAWVSNRHGSPQIWLMSASGGSQSRLTRVGNYNQEPAWCPKCEKPTIAFTARDEKSHFDVFTIDVGSGTLSRLTENQGNNEHPTWAPNGRAIAVASSRGGIWVMAADGKSPARQVYKGNASTPVWGPAHK